MGTPRTPAGELRKPVAPADVEALVDRLDKYRTRKIDPIDPFQEAVWACKIGGALPHRLLPDQSDAPMREAVQEAYKRVTGTDDGYCFSGWGGSLDEGERAVVEGRAPVYEATDYALFKQAADTIEDRQAEVERLVGVVRFLWSLLDNIDTADDMAKSNDAAYRRIAHRQQKRRWETGITTDGYTLDLSNAKAPAIGGPT